jgi:flotillin
MIDICFIVAEIVFIVVAIIAGLAIYARRYVRVPPNMAMVVFGRKEPDGKGYVIIRGGGKFVIPIFEDYAFLPLNIRNMIIDLANVILDIKGDRSKIHLIGVAQVKIASDIEGLETASQCLLHKTDEQINEIARTTIEGHTRDYCSTSKFETIDVDRNDFAHKIQALVDGDLKKMGMTILSFVVKDIEKEGKPSSNGSNTSSLPTDIDAILKEILERIRKIEVRIEHIEKEKK